MLDLKKYGDVKYDDLNYNCLHFAIDVYRDLTDINLSFDVIDLCTTRTQRRICPEKLRQFVLIDAPIDPCIAVMRSPMGAHCGVYTNGSIIHLDSDGIKSQPPHIAQLHHQSVKYYDYNHKTDHLSTDCAIKSIDMVANT